MWSALLALGLALHGGVCTAQVSFQGSLGVTSDDVHRGLTQSSGKPALQGGAVLRVPSGAYLSAWGSTLRLDHLGPDRGDGTGYELDLVLGYGRPITLDWAWDVNLGRYLYVADHRQLDYDYVEVAAALDWRNRFRLSAAYTPEATDHTRRIQPQLLEGPRSVVELSVQWPLRRWVAVNAGLGYNNSTQVSDVDYRYWSAGSSLFWRRFTLSLAHYGTDSDARRRWRDGRAAHRFVASLSLGFD